MEIHQKEVSKLGENAHNTRITCMYQYVWSSFYIYTEIISWYFMQDITIKF